MQYAPIIIFAFNRPKALRNVVCSLLQNTEARESDLYIFVDGARLHKDGELKEVELVREYVISITGFKTLHYTFSEVNKGLGASIIDGVSEVINRYGKVIVLEDDLCVQPNFLAFMNQGLKYYEKVKGVFSICGYNNKIKIPKDYKADAYIYNRSSSWGWATWKDRWDTIDWKLEPFDIYKSKARAFCCWAGSDAWKMLNDWHKGKNNSWAIRFVFAQFLQNKKCVNPCYSLINNRGFDGQGTNCKSWSRFKFELESTGKKNFVWPTQLSINSCLFKRAMWYNSVFIRIYSRIMYLIK